jgi:hypothetical protein
VSSSFSGTDNSIDIPSLLATSENNAIEIHANGFLHHWDETPAWQIQIDRIRLSEQSATLLNDIIADQKTVSFISNLGTINLTGQSEGLGHSIDSEIHLQSDAGDVDADFNMNQQKQFMPLYEQMEREIYQVNRNARALANEVEKKKNPSDRDYEIAASALSNTRVREGEIEAKYFEKFSKILSKKQLFQLKQTERKFTQEMLSKKRKRQ